MAFNVITDEVTVERIAQWDTFLDDAGCEKRVGVVILPRLRTPEEVSALLVVVGRAPRWTCKPVAWKKHGRPDDVLVGVSWRTAVEEEGLRLGSSVIGFAPIGSMPVTRRAPYVALAVWPGGRDNEFARSKGGEVGFIDVPPVFAARRPEWWRPKNIVRKLRGEVADRRATYRRMFDLTTADVGHLLQDPAEDAHRLRKAAFCLPRATVTSELLPG